MATKSSTGTAATGRTARVVSSGSTGTRRVSQPCTNRIPASEAPSTKSSLMRSSPASKLTRPRRLEPASSDPDEGAFSWRVVGGEGRGGRVIVCFFSPPPPPPAPRHLLNHRARAGINRHFYFLELV